MKNIAVLITCHNRKNKTISCLQFLFEAELQSKTKLDVFLVDDGSTDGTTKAVKEIFSGKVNIIQGAGDLYWNKGMCLAWEVAIKTKRYSYYLWLNDDTFLYPDALQILLDNSQQKNNKAIICGTTISSQTNKITYGGRKYDGTVIEPQEYLIECDLINGNCLLVPDYVFRIVGGLDTIFIHAIGDYDYGLRAKKKNIKSFVATKVIGTCETYANLPHWCLPEYSFIQRVKNLYSPLGSSHPYYFFIFEYRHFGLMQAIKHFISIHLRLFFPKLWL